MNQAEGHASRCPASASASASDPLTPERLLAAAGEALAARSAIEAFHLARSAVRLLPGDPPDPDSDFHFRVRAIRLLTSVIDSCKRACSFHAGALAECQARWCCQAYGPWSDEAAQTFASSGKAMLSTGIWDGAAEAMLRRAVAIHEAADESSAALPPALLAYAKAVAPTRPFQGAALARRSLRSSFAASSPPRLRGMDLVALARLLPGAVVAGDEDCTEGLGRLTALAGKDADALLEKAEEEAARGAAEDAGSLLLEAAVGRLGRGDPDGACRILCRMRSEEEEENALKNVRIPDKITIAKLRCLSQGGSEPARATAIKRACHICGSPALEDSENVFPLLLAHCSYVDACGWDSDEPQRYLKEAISKLELCLVS